MSENYVTEPVGWHLPDDPFNPRDWTEIGPGVHLAPVDTPPPTTTKERFTDLTTFAWECGIGSYLDAVEAEAEFNREHTECTWTAPKSQTIALDIHEIGPELWSLLATGQLDQALLLDSNLLAPPKRPPDPERPFWAVRPDRMRRNAIKPTRRVK